MRCERKVESAPTAFSTSCNPFEVGVNVEVDVGELASEVGCALALALRLPLPLPNVFCGALLLLLNAGLGTLFGITFRCAGSVLTLAFAMDIPFAGAGAVAVALEFTFAFGFTPELALRPLASLGSSALAAADRR